MASYGTIKNIIVMCGSKQTNHTGIRMYIHPVMSVYYYRISAVDIPEKLLCTRRY